jgi:hypothetical protein
MKNSFIIPALILMSAATVSAQTIELKQESLESIGVNMSFGKLDGKSAVRVAKDPAVTEADEPTFVRLKGSNFKDGTIEVNLLSKLLPGAPPTARGFIGVAFRVNESNMKFECIYIRPTNGRTDDQVRRNHSTQYFSYPDFKFDRLRKEAPEKYESYADMGLGEWIKMKIVVKGVQARLYLNDNKEPSLIVNDLKLGADQSGGVGLYVDNGTLGYFADLKVSQ